MRADGIQVNKDMFHRCFTPRLTTLGGCMETDQLTFPQCVRTEHPVANLIPPTRFESATLASHKDGSRRRRRLAVRKPRRPTRSVWGKPRGNELQRLELVACHTRQRRPHGSLLERRGPFRSVGETHQIRKCRSQRHRAIPHQLGRCRPSRCQPEQYKHVSLHTQRRYLE